MSAQPTEPLRPDDEPTVILPPRRAHGCTAGHDQPHNPTWHPRLGLVPSLTNVIFAVILIVVVIGLEAWLIPAAIPWTVGLLALALAVSALVQFLLGHRGTCWLWRTLRWWLGPVGAVIDPVDAG